MSCGRPPIFKIFLPNFNELRFKPGKSMNESQTMKEILNNSYYVLST